MPQRIIAFEIDDSTVRAAVLETTFRDYRIVGLHRLALDPASGSLEAQLRRFVEQHNLSGNTVLSGLAGDRVAWRKLFLPFRDRKRLSQTVPFELETHVPFDLNEAVTDYQVLHRDRGGTRVLAALVRREDLERHLNLMHAAGLDPKTVDLAPLATLNSLRLIPDLPPCFFFLDLGVRTVTVAFYRDGSLHELRTLTPTARTPPSPAETPRTEGDQATAPLLAALLAELRWTLLAMNGGPADDDVPCYLAGERTDVDVCAPAIAAELGLSVRRVDTFLSDDPHLRGSGPAAAYTAAIGLALREVSAGGGMGLNFRRGEYAYQRGQQEVQRGLRNIAALAAVVVALTVSDLYLDYQRQVSIVRDLEAQISNVVRATLPDLRDTRNPMLALQEEIDRRRRELDTLNEIVPVSSSTSIDIFRAIAAAIPNSIRIDADDYMMDADAIRMRGNTDSFEFVDAIRQHILGTGFFSGVEVKDARADPKGNGVDFRLIMRLSKDVVRGRAGS